MKGEEEQQIISASQTKRQRMHLTSRQQRYIKFWDRNDCV